MKRRLKRKRRTKPENPTKYVKKTKPKPKSPLLSTIPITYDDDFNPHDFEMTEEITKLLTKYEEMCFQNPRRAIRELRRVAKQFPKVPQFKNYIVSAFKIAGDDEKSYDYNDKVLQLHPNYLFGLTSKTIQLWENGELDKIPDLLGGEPISILRTFPERELFYVMEVFNYYKVLIYYWTAVGDKKRAKEAFELLGEIQPGHEDLFRLKLEMLKGGIS